MYVCVTCLCVCLCMWSWLFACGMYIHRESDRFKYAALCNMCYVLHLFDFLISSESLSRCEFALTVTGVTSSREL
jgi:hypothetical protein